MTDLPAPVSVAVPDEERIDWPQVRLIFAANWRIWFNRWTQRPVYFVFNLLALLAFLAFAVAISGGIGFYVAKWREHSPATAAAAVHWAFLTVFFMLTVTPVLGFRGNEFLDVGKLFGFPVASRTVFAATLCCLMGSGAVLFFCLPLAGAVVGYGWRGPPGSILGGLIVALLLVLVAVALGQFLMLAFLNTLKSRKWRDFSMVAVTLVVGGMSVGVQVLTRRSGFGGGQIQGALDSFDRVKDYTLPLPSWWAAHALTGEGLLRFLPIVAMLALVAWLVRASAVLQERAFYGEVEDAPIAEAARGGLIARIGSRLPDPLGALVEKELSILRREPAVRSILVGQSMYPLMWGGIGIYTIVNKGSVQGLVPLLPFGGIVAYPLLLMETGLLMNLLGLEGGGAVHTLLLPVRRRTLLLGKDVAYLLGFGTLNAAVAVVVTVIACIVTHAASVGDCIAWSLLAAIEGYCALAMGLAVGNVVSVLAPMRLAVRDRRALRQQVGGREGCLRALSGLAAVAGTMTLAVPVAALFHAPRLLSSLGFGVELPSWTLLGFVPLAAAISFGAMYAGAALGGSWLETREEFALSRLAKSDE